MTKLEKVIKGLEQHISKGCMSERELLQPVICPYFNNPHCIIALLRDALELLKENAAPVKHGRWIEYPECLGYTGAYSEDHIVCSECHDVWNIMDNDVDKFDFCPHCGAKMDGERKEE